MPTYEYNCDACEHNFDEFQSINDKPLKKSQMQEVEATTGVRRRRRDPL